jgi:dihydroorotate dehydrogenase
MYKQIIRPLLFRLDAETAHEFAVEWLARASRSSPLLSLIRRLYANKVADLPVEVMGLEFRNPVGLAAGMDKEARAVAALAALGFGFLELGTVTPLAQPGNPQPRMFRLPAQQAIINRMGFNSGGIRPFLENVARTVKPVPLGINLGKNAVTPIEKAADDYVSGLRQLYLYADYFAINISSPNTRNLRELQSEDQLDGLLASLAATRAELTETFRRRVPMAVKIAPDIDDAAIPPLCALLRKHGIDGVIATNTTIARPDVDGLPHAGEDGGLSGQPLKTRANQVVSLLFAELADEIPIIGVGGIASADDAWQRLVSGAALVQLYSALVYRGPGLVAEIVNGLHERVAAGGHSSLREAVLAARRAID